MVAGVRSMDRSDIGWFQVIAGRLENFIIRTIILSTMILVAVQVAMINPTLRLYLSRVDRLEGIPLSSYSPLLAKRVAVSASYREAAAESQVPSVQPTVTITLELTGADRLGDAQVLVNGVAVADFDFPQVTVRVKPGDSLEITCPGEKPGVEFKIESTSPEVISPREGTTFIASRRVALGTVALARLVMNKQ